MSYNSLHKCLIDNRLWAVVSFGLIAYYLSPLFHPVFYVPVFDNLDSTVVWYKILAHSGKIFAGNDAVIPNMMNGLPRSSYGSEFDVLLWLYYFFDAKTAFVINEVLIHVVAFFSAFVFLKKYVVKPNPYYGLMPVFLGSVYFALLPFWSGAGLTLPLLPLVTYSLLNIKNGTDRKRDWVFLALLPLYTSFILLYMFYIVLAGIYWLYLSLKSRTVRKKMLLALFMMGTVFLLKEYRLVLSMFFDHAFVSHRSEFDIFFKDDLRECYRLSLVKLLDGHVPHAQSLQMKYLLPVALSALVLTFIRRRFGRRESITVWVLILGSIFVGLWPILLIDRFTLPGIALAAMVSWYFVPRYRLLPSMLLLVVALSLAASVFEYQGLRWLGETFPVLKALNLTRLYFVEPLIFLVLFSFAVVIMLRKVRYAVLPLLLLFSLQVVYSFEKSFYQTSLKEGYASFRDYYVPDVFENLKKQFTTQELHNLHFAGYGMEPAVALFNGLYTTDGYSTNYPLDYKHRFREVFSRYRSNRYYDCWGSKVYIASIPSRYRDFLKIKGLSVEKLQFDIEPLCRLGTDYLISPYRFLHPEAKRLKLEYAYRTGKNRWDIFVYKTDCTKQSALSE